MLQSDQSMKGKVCLITGGTSGIGLVTARELARKSATIVLVGRSKERCEKTVADIRRETGSENVSFLLADLSSQKETRRLAQDFLAQYDRLDVLINNAGAIYALWQESVDGIEMTMALNHVAYFLLTELLLDTLKKSAPARIINVSSGAHHDVKGFDFLDPELRTGAGGRKAVRSEMSSLFYSIAMPWAHPGFVQYAQSKLANLLFTHELAKRLAGTGVTVNALHPGFVSTGFTSGNGVYGKFMRIWSTLFGISADEGAKTTIYLASSPEVANVSGKYFAKEKPVATSAAAVDDAAAKKLWQMSEEWIGKSR